MKQLCLAGQEGSASLPYWGMFLGLWGTLQLPQCSPCWSVRMSGGPGTQTADPVNGGHHPTTAPKALRAFQSTMKMLPPLNPPGCGLWRLWEPSVGTGILRVRSQSPSEGLRVELPLRAGSWWPLMGSLGWGPRSPSSREESGPEAQGPESVSSPPFSFADATPASRRRM